MKTRLVPLALIAVMVLAFGAIAAACGDGGDGGGDELTLEEYFQRLETIGQDYDDAGSALNQEMEAKFDAAAPEDEQIALFRDFLDEALPLVSDFVNDLDDLSPPAAAADAHNDAVEAGQDLVGMFENVIVVADEATLFADAAALLDAPGFTEASDSFTNACLALQEIADDNGIDVDLRCG